MSGWGCPHDLNGKCLHVQGRDCDPGMKGCVLYGRFRWADESKNRPARSAPGAQARRSPEPRTKAAPATASRAKRGKP